jgi:hypothetical protein
MKTFLDQHDDEIHGVLSGFDRIRFRGTLRPLSYVVGLLGFFQFISLLLKQFQAYVNGTSLKLKIATEQLAKSTPAGKVVYLQRPANKAEVIEQLMRKHQIPDDTTGLLAVLSCVEPCDSVGLSEPRYPRRIVRNRD